MNLKFKLNILLLVILITVSSVIIHFSTDSIERAFVSVENKYFNGFYSELTHEIELYLGYKDKILKYWSRWDALYNYVESESPDGIEEVLNLAPSSFKSLDLKFIIIEKDGQILYGKKYNEMTKAIEPVDSYFFSEAIMNKHKSGLFYYDNKSYAVFGSNIGNNDGTKISDGHLIIGYDFGIEEIRESFLEDHFSVDVIYDPASFSKFQGAYAEREKNYTKMHYKIPYLNRSELGFQITIIFDNDITDLSNNIIRFFIILVIAVVISLFIFLNVFLNKMIISRIDRFNNIVNEIRENNDLSKRIQVKGNDEISQLKRQFNYMISELEENRKVLEIDAMVDSHTGAYVKKYGYNLLRQYIIRSKEEDKDLFGVYIDIDDLKYINDTFGHIEGDRLLNIVTNCLFNNILDEMAIIRVGGDEFFVFSYGKDEKTVLDYVDRVIDDIDSYNDESLFMKSISFSWGHAKYNESMTMEEFIELTDQRMYENKQSKDDV